MPVQSAKFKFQSLRHWLALWLPAFGLCVHGHAQETFQNLNFESAEITNVSGSGVYPVSKALPGWTVVGVEATLSNEVLYNNYDLGNTSASLQGTNGPFPALDGKFSVNLFGGDSSNFTNGASISQTGLVPTGSLSIRFIAQATVGGAIEGPLLVSLGGQNIPYFAISTGPNYTTYAGDVSAFEGHVELLSFDAPLGINNYWTLDDIQFSTSPVPEPRTCALILCGAAAFGVNRCRRRYASSKCKN